MPLSAPNKTMKHNAVCVYAWRVMQRCGRLLSELFVQLILVCESGGGYDCSHVALQEEIASLMYPGAPRPGFGRSLAHSKRKGERARKRRWGEEKEERGAAGKWCCAVCWWRWRESSQPREIFSVDVEKWDAGDATKLDVALLQLGVYSDFILSRRWQRISGAALTPPPVLGVKCIAMLTHI